MDISDYRNKDAVQNTLKQGAVSDFWKIILSSLEDTIAMLKEEKGSDELAALPAEQYKVESEILRHKIKYLETLKNMPANLASWVELPDEDKTNFDPYFQSKDMEVRAART